MTKLGRGARPQVPGDAVRPSPRPRPRPRSLPRPRAGGRERGPDDEFPTDTVLVLRVEVGDAGYRDPAGNPVPETKLVGSGDALLFHGGRLVRGTWKKEGLDTPLQLTTKAGKLVVPPGRTWIELVPKNGGDVTFGK